MAANERAANERARQVAAEARQSELKAQRRYESLPEANLHQVVSFLHGTDGDGETFRMTGVRTSVVRTALEQLDLAKTGTNSDGLSVAEPLEVSDVLPSTATMSARDAQSTRSRISGYRPRAVVAEDCRTSNSAKLSSDADAVLKKGLLWFLGYVFIVYPIPGSLYWGYRALQIAAKARRCGVPNPRSNRRALMVTLIPPVIVALSFLAFYANQAWG